MAGEAQPPGGAGVEDEHEGDLGPEVGGETGVAPQEPVEVLGEVGNVTLST